jgi:hypothetical protein
MSLNEHEPDAIPTDERPVWELVIEDMQERNRIGTAKHKTPLQVSNGRDSLIDAFQESMDLTVYLRQEMERRKVLEAEVVSLREENRRLLEDNAALRIMITYYKGTGR